MQPRSRSHPCHAVFGSCLLLLLGACAESSAPEAPATGSIAAVKVEADSASKAVDDRRTRARSALSENRLFAPDGDNALELLLDELALAQNEPIAGSQRMTDSFTHAEHLAGLQQTINELYTLGLPWIEDALDAGRFDDAARVQRLLLRARPGSVEAVALESRIHQARLAHVTVPATEQASSPSSRTTTPTATQIARIPSPESPRVQDARPTPLARAATPQVLAATMPNAAPPATAVEPGAASQARTATQLPSAVDTPLVPLRRPTPRYPTRARSRRAEGWVRVEFVVSNDGSVTDSKVVGAEPAGLFEREALNAIERWRFAPLAQPQRSQQLFNFRPN